MDFKIFRKALSELEKNGKPQIALHQYGEPLLHPSIGKLIAYAKKRGFKIILYTNGTQLNDSMIEMLRENLVDGVRVSFVPDKKKYESLWKGANYEQTLQNLLSFSEKSNSWEEGPKLTINLLHEYNSPLKKTMDEAAKIFGKYQKTQFSFDEIAPLSGSDPNLNYRPVEQYQTPCVQTYTHIAILHNGDVSPCCADLNGEFILGNINNAHLSDMRNSKKMIMLREKLFTNKACEINICKNCTSCHSEKTLLSRDLNRVATWLFRIFK